MTFLYWLESLRTPLMDAFMSTITHAGEEIVFMVVAIAVLWCVDKYDGYYLLTIGFLGTQINQLLKVSFRVERPWIRDPQFSPVPNAIPEATGYSFPSGHTQSAVGTYGTLARLYKQPWWRAICVTLCLLVPFSRMYLGVHTPLDVGVSMAIALVLVIGVYPLIARARSTAYGMRPLIIGMLVLSIAQTIYMTVSFHDSTAAELQSALENAYKMLGAVIGFLVAYELDERYIHFDPKAVWWAQLLKVTLGLALTFAVKEGSGVVFDGVPFMPAAKCLSYFLTVLFAGVVWPLTFRLFASCSNRT